MVIDAFKLTGDDHSLLILPLFHVNGIVVGTLSPLVAGGRATIAGRFSPKTFFDRLEQSRATYFSAVPTIYTMLCGLPAEVQPGHLVGAVRGLRRGAGQRRAAGASSSRATASRSSRATGCPRAPAPARSTRSTASASPAPSGCRCRGRRSGSSTPRATPVPDGEAGEVVIKGPNVMRGYLNRPEETAKTLVDGWLHTGDVGRFDEDGYLVLVDRAKDMIIRGGENIYPKEIEAVVYQLPEIAEAAVVGRARPGLRRGAGALSSRCTPARQLDTERDPRAHLPASLSKYKRPAEITILDDLPKNAVGKIDKPALRRKLLDDPPTTRDT